MLKDLGSILDNFSKVKVLVVGDVMLDRYWWGNVSRISPEAPVPVVSLETTSLALGGAANVAANIAGLGATPFLIGVTGDDEDARFLPEILQKTNIKNFKLFPINKRKTTVKTRIIAHDQQVVRIDSESTEPVSRSETEIILAQIQKFLEKADIVLVSDYNKGFLTEKFLSQLITLANKKSKKILIDPKGKDYSKYKKATLLTPNQREAADACGLEADNQSLTDKAAKILLKDLALKALVITQGEKGMTILEKENKLFHLKATARKVYDVTGAGDTVIAVLAVALASGLSLQQSAEIANLAAGLVVEKVGTTVITKELLHARS